ncbi:DUF1214 domain-containing protein [Mucilaginibacter sp. McL0603]|uniref:DUF1214 domain-containing protein n=1 Tax=Mucilaginibacter sp. McL0603 TaxID=3415670 RepID=UPI003CED5B4A
MRNYYKTPLTLLLILLSCVYLPGCKSNHPAQKSIEKDTVPVSDQEIVDAYTYLYGRYLVIQQENHDINTERVGYNKIKYNPLGSAQFVNPNLDVANLESWIAVDSTHAVILNIPKIENRYYTVELLDGWGEVITNINERNYPKTPYGKFALCIKGTNPPIPSDAVKIELPSAKIKMLARVELKDTPAIAKKLQKQFTLTVPDSIRIDSPVNIPEFTSQKPIGGAIFDKVEEVLSSYPDKMPKAKDLQATAEKVAIYNSSGPNEKRRVDSIVVARAIPAFLAGAKGFGTQKGGWSVSYVAGNFGDDMMARDIINYGGLWANAIQEAIYFVGLTDSGKEPLSGDNVYEICFSKDSLPGTMVNAFWSVTLYSVPDYRVVKNSIKRYNINNLSGLKSNDDESVSIWLASKMPKDIPQTNWLPTPKGKGFALTFRMYVSKDPVLQGKWFPAAIHKVK